MTTERLPDYDLEVLVDAAAKGVVNSRVAHHGGPLWEALSDGTKNSVREQALPFIFHGTKALAELGYRKPRTVTTVEELDALPVGSIVLDGNGFTWDKWQDEEGDEFNYWATTLDRRPYQAKRINLPATVLHEGDA